MAWLVLWWKLSGFTPAVTRTAMLLFAALGLTAVFRLARFALNTQVAAAATLCTALYPVFFAQSSMAHVDLAAAALSLWGIAFFVEERRALCVLFFSLAVLAKETAVLVPVALAAWEIAWWLAGPAERARPALAPPPRPLWELFALLLFPAAVLAAWFAYHYQRTGYVFGNPEFVRYNISATLHPVRFLLAGLRRLWQVTGYMNLFVLTGAAALAMMLPPRPEWNSGEAAGLRARIPPHIQAFFAVVVLAQVGALSLIGGAVLARYLLTAVPLVIILCVSTLRRRVRGWPAVVAVVCGAFLLGLFINPPYRFAMEDNLAYRDYVLMHKAAAGFLSSRHAASRVLTAWPATDELQKPYLGYLKSAVPVVPLENFSAPQIARAARDTSLFDLAYVFSTKYEAPSQPALLRWWERLQEPFFDYHRDLPPELVARALGGRIVWRQQRNGQWAAVIALERVQNARVEPGPGPRVKIYAGPAPRAPGLTMNGWGSRSLDLVASPESASASAEAAAASAATAAFQLGPRLVHGDGASPKLRPVQALDRVLRLGVARHLHEAEAPRLAGVAVADQRHFIDLPECLECGPQLLLSHPVVEVADIDVLH